MNSQQNDFINQVLAEYQEKLDQQGQFSDYQEETNQIDVETLKYYGYQDKKSITIKPLKMHKDLISLRKQNQQKKLQIKQLQRMNLQLKDNYHGCMKQNQKVQKFLKDIQFTFKNDKKTQKANQIMLKAKRMLYRQAIQCQSQSKKLTKSPQANSIQQIKTYIQFLQSQKLRINSLICNKKLSNQTLRCEQDFNHENQAKYHMALERIEQMLNIEMQKCKRHHQIYNIQKGMVRTGLKEKEIQLNKKDIQKQYHTITQLALQKQGQQYEIVILQKKRKDKVKILQQKRQFRNDMDAKQKNLSLLQKQLKQKLKTYDYMSKWTKQLKLKLQQKKQTHINNKVTYQQKINTLSRQFQEWNKKYKHQLVDDQGIKKKGNTVKEIGINKADQLIIKGVQEVGKRVRVVKLDEINNIVKKLRLYLMHTQQDISQFIKQKILKQKYNPLINSKQLGLFSFLVKQPSIASQSSKQQSQQKQVFISLEQLLHNLKMIQVLKDQSANDLLKMARYVIEDNSGNFTKISNNSTINVKLAFTILSKLLQMQLKTSQIVQVTIKMKEFLSKSYQSLRYDLLKLILSVGGVPNQFMTNHKQDYQSSNIKKNHQMHLQLQLNEPILLQVLRKHLVQEYYVVRFKQLIQIIIYTQFKQVSKPKLGMFDRVCQKIVGKRLTKDVFLTPNQPKQIQKTLTKIQQKQNLIEQKSIQIEQKRSQMKRNSIQIKLKSVKISDQPKNIQQQQQKKLVLDNFFTIIRTQNKQQIKIIQNKNIFPKKMNKKTSWIDNLTNFGNENSSESQFQDNNY